MDKHKAEIMTLILDVMEMSHKRTNNYLDILQDPETQERLAETNPAFRTASSQQRLNTRIANLQLQEQARLKAILHHLYKEFKKEQREEKLEESELKERILLRKEKEEKSKEAAAAQQMTRRQISEQEKDEFHKLLKRREALINSLNEEIKKIQEWKNTLVTLRDNLWEKFLEKHHYNIPHEIVIINIERDPDPELQLPEWDYKINYDKAELFQKVGNTVREIDIDKIDKTSIDEFENKKNEAIEDSTNLFFKDLLINIVKSVGMSPTLTEQKLKFIDHIFSSPELKAEINKNISEIKNMGPSIVKMQTALNIIGDKLNYADMREKITVAEVQDLNQNYGKAKQNLETNPNEILNSLEELKEGNSHAENIMKNSDNIKEEEKKGLDDIDSILDEPEPSPEPESAPEPSPHM